MRILITGGRGFIGSHLGTKLVQMGYDVSSLDNLSHACSMDIPYENVVGDICDKDLVEKLVADSDIVFHLAAEINIDYSIENPEETLKANVLGTMILLNACTKHNKRMIYASSSEVYGSAQQPMMSENHQLDPQSPYGATKAAADRMCKAYFDTYGTEVVILRNFNTFGEYQRNDSYGGVISKFCEMGMKRFDLPVFGSGFQTRDYMHVSDAVRSYLTVMEYGKPGQVYNAGTSLEVSVNAIASAIAEHYGVKIDHKQKRPGEVIRLRADTHKIKQIGFFPQTKFSDGLKQFIKWFDENYKSIPTAK